MIYSNFYEGTPNSTFAISIGFPVFRQGPETGIITPTFLQLLSDWKIR